MPQNPGQFNSNDDIIFALDTIGIADTTDTRINPATYDAQTDGSQETQIVDSSGNVIETAQDADGDYHLNTALIQKIITSTNNSTQTNLAAGATFTGTADETFGISGIQVYHASDQDCTIYIDQSIDDTFADSTQTITDELECLANNPCSRTLISVSPYYRMRVTNNGSSTTTKLSTFTGMTPVINPLPRSLSDDDRLKTESTLVGQQNTERHVWVTPTNSISVESPVRLVGTNFDGTTLDPNFWTPTTANGGTVTQAGEIQLDTSTNAAGSASYTSVRSSRFVVGAALKFQGLFKFVTAATTDNVRRCGAYGATDGFFFQLDGSTFSVGSRKASSDTLVDSGSFNGNYGPSFTPVNTQYYKLEIEWTPKGVFWYVDGKLLHKIGTGHLSNILSLPINFENVNAGSTTDVAFDCLGVAIVRLGNLETNPTSKYQSGTTAGLVLKYGAGALRGVVISGVANNSVITLYDNTAASGTVIWSYGTMGSQTQPYDLDFKTLPFSIGLTLVISGASSNITVIYE